MPSHRETEAQMGRSLWGAGCCLVGSQSTGDPWGRRRLLSAGREWCRPSTGLQKVTRSVDSGFPDFKPDFKSQGPAWQAEGSGVPLQWGQRRALTMVSGNPRECAT